VISLFDRPAFHVYPQYYPREVFFVSRDRNTGERTDVAIKADDDKAILTVDGQPADLDEVVATAKTKYIWVRARSGYVIEWHAEYLK